MRESYRIKSTSANSLRIGTGTRILITGVTSVACLYLSNPYAMLILVAISFIYLLADSYLKLVLKVYFFVLIMLLCAVCSVSLLAQIMPSLMRTAKLSTVIIPFERILIMVNVVLAMASNSSIQGLSTTLNKVFLPGFIKLPMLVTIRFIPAFFHDIKQLNEAVTLRFTNRNKRMFWFRHPMLWSRVFLMPLLVRLIRTGDELAVAAELKGITPDIKLSDTKMSPAAPDIAVLGVLLFTVMSAVIVQKVL